LIEIDGRQHFEQVKHWKSPQLQEMNDVEKTQLAIENGLKVVHMFQEDVWNGKFDWRKVFMNLLYELDPLVTNNVVYLMSRKNVYMNFRTFFPDEIIMNCNLDL